MRTDTNPTEAEYERGRQAGAAGIAAGRPRLYWQTRGSWGELLTKLMADRFSVVVQHTSDIMSHTEVSFHSGYNSTIAEWVNQKFGEGSFESVLNEVERYREQQARRYLDSCDNLPNSSAPAPDTPKP